MVIYRQGDVVLVRVAELSEATVAVPREDGRLVLAEGEATGHAHVIEAEEATLVTMGQAWELYLLVEGSEPVALTHEEHDSISVPPGWYRVVRQREYAPDENRLVGD